MKVGIDEALVGVATRKSRSLAIVQQPAAQLYRRFVEGTLCAMPKVRSAWPRIDFFPQN